jgi:putative peptide zinc metalloprotease protein
MMLLVFAPSLYCDVSDSWRLKSKWQRIAVSAAGMLVEVVIAAVATIVWWHALPGIVQLVAMNVMIVCTVGTVLVNGNPLLRYDGYYILSDLVETPNLWQRSRDVLRGLASKWLLGEPPADDPLVPTRRRGWLAAYAAASKAYLAFVCVAIVWGLVEILYPLRLQNLAYAVGVTVIGGALIGPLHGALQLIRDPSRRSQILTRRMAFIGSVALAASVGVLAMPVTYHVRAPLVLVPEDAARMFATLDGTLIAAPTPGRHVKRGEVIGRLSNPEVERELGRIEGEHGLRKLRVEHLERLRGVDPTASDELPTARAALADVERRLTDRRQEADRLNLTAPTDGVVLPAPRVTDTRHPVPSKGWSPDTRLATWSGSLLEAQNLGAAVEPGTLVCLVSESTQLTAVLLVEDSEVKRVQPGQSVQMCVDQLPGQVISGEVVEVARREMLRHNDATTSQVEMSTLYDGLLPPDMTGRAVYKVHVRFEAPPQPLVIGGRGQAKVAAERITVARSIGRNIAKTFRLPM